MPILQAVVDVEAVPVPVGGPRCIGAPARIAGPNFLRLLQCKEGGIFSVVFAILFDKHSSTPILNFVVPRPPLCCSQRFQGPASPLNHGSYR